MKNFLLLLILISFRLNAQIGIGTISPHASAALEIKDNSKGILIPRMTMAQRDLIANPAEGLMIYQVDNSVGYWYFTSGQWQSVNGGKATIILNDESITNAEAQAKINNDLGPNTQTIKIYGCSNLTAVDLSKLASALEIAIYSNSNLQSVNLQNLKTCDMTLNISYCPALVNLNLTALEKIPGISFVSNGTISLNLPNLRQGGSFGLTDNSNLSTISVPLLAYCKSIYIARNSSLGTLSFPSLTNITGKLTFVYDDLLTNVSFPILSSAGTFDFTSNIALPSLSFPSLTKLTDSLNGSGVFSCPNLHSVTLNNLGIFKNTLFQVVNSSLPSSQVNYLLSKFVSINPPITNKSILLYQNTPLAPPTGQGISDKATLITNGNTVQTD